MGMQSTKTKMRMFSNIITSASARSTSLRIIGAVIAMASLLWTIRHGYQATTEPRRHTLHGQWILGFGALVMLIGFLLLALGLPVISDLFLNLSEELQYPEENDILQSNNLNVKADVCV